MTTVTLYEAEDGNLYLHLEGDPILWRMNLLAASTFLTDALVVANRDTAAHPDIFSAPTSWQEMTGDTALTTAQKEGFAPIAVLQLDPEMGLEGAAYTLFKPDGF